jgi:hypothetical protein
VIITANVGAAEWLKIPFKNKYLKYNDNSFTAEAQRPRKGRPNSILNFFAKPLRLRAFAVGVLRLVLSLNLALRSEPIPDQQARAAGNRRIRHIERREKIAGVMHLHEIDHRAV